MKLWCLTLNIHVRLKLKNLKLIVEVKLLYRISRCSHRCWSWRLISLRPNTHWNKYYLEPQSPCFPMRKAAAVTVPRIIDTELNMEHHSEVHHKWKYMFYIFFPWLCNFSVTRNSSIKEANPVRNNCTCDVRTSARVIDLTQLTIKPLMICNQE